MHLIDMEAQVCSFKTQSGNWDRAKWETFLPRWVVDRILMTTPPTGSEDDVFCWRNAPDGFFSVKSAYDWLYHRQTMSNQRHWRDLWHWGIPERVKLFMWQVFHDRLPTNVMRARHNPSVLNTCPFQCESEESILHVLRDCEQAQRVWVPLTNNLYSTMFFSGNLQEWLHWNLKNSPGNRRMSRWAWQRVFTTTCWLLWKNRCCRAFDGSGVNPKEIVHRCIYHLSESVLNGRLNHQIFQVSERGLARWEPPAQGFFRIDVDGSSFSSSQAACGGVIRDSQGNWLRGFQQKLGNASPTAAEIHAIQSGLQLCKQMGLKKIRLFTDSLQAIHLLSTNCGVDHPLYDIVSATRSLIYADWDLEISHSHRECTRCADFLARMAHLNSQEYMEIGVSPMECFHLFALECGDIPHEHSLGPVP